MRPHPFTFKDGQAFYDKQVLEPFPHGGTQNCIKLIQILAQHVEALVAYRDLHAVLGLKKKAETKADPKLSLCKTDINEAFRALRVPYKIELIRGRGCRLVRVDP